MELFSIRIQRTFQLVSTLLDIEELKTMVAEKISQKIISKMGI